MLQCLQTIALDEAEWTRSAVPSPKDHGNAKSPPGRLDSGGLLCYLTSCRGAITAPATVSPVTELRGEAFLFLLLHILQR